MTISEVELVNTSLAQYSTTAMGVVCFVARYWQGDVVSWWWCGELVMVWWAGDGVVSWLIVVVVWRTMVNLYQWWGLFSSNGSKFMTNRAVTSVDKKKNFFSIKNKFQKKNFEKLVLVFLNFYIFSLLIII